MTVKEDGKNTPSRAQDLMTVSEAALEKGVSRTAIYAAVRDGRLPAIRKNQPILLNPSDVSAWEPVRYGARSGVDHPGRQGQQKVMSDETRRKISEGQKRRWASKRNSAREG